ncbi:MAG: ribosome maturation factor RimP [Bacteriovoracia bacterium]
METTELLQTKQIEDRLADLIEPMLAPLAYSVVAVEVQLGRTKKLRLFIDRPANGITIDDCVTASHALDQPLDANPEVDEIFAGPYELEVSSPGLDRPLRRPQDYLQFVGSRARVQTVRTLTGEELHNEAHQAKNPKQKVFIGVIDGVEGQAENKAVCLTVDKSKVRLPMGLIYKANLDPVAEAASGKHGKPGKNTSKKGKP